MFAGGKAFGPLTSAQLMVVQKSDNAAMLSGSVDLVQVRGCGRQWGLVQ